MADKSELLQGTLDLLILKIVALGPVHGYAIAQRIQQISKDVLRCSRGLFIQPFTGSKSGVGSKQNGANRKLAEKPSSTA
jgi:hypothetical protein